MENGDSSVVNQNNGQNGKQRKFSRRDEELIRLIGQHLVSLGLDQSAKALVKESGTMFENRLAQGFRKAIQDGDWSSAFTALEQLSPEVKKKSKVTQMKFLILEQKFLELLEEGECIAAFNCLRQELAQLQINEERLATLAQVIMLKEIKQIRALTGWQGKGRQSRQALMDQLQHYLPHHIMLPPRRLQKLLKQAQLYQQSQSLCQMDHATSLLYDAKPPQKEIPEQCCQTLSEHRDEVNICKFSHDGRFLATASKDKSLILWSIDGYGAKFLRRVQLAQPITYLAWSPNDKMLLLTGNEESPCVWVCQVDGETAPHEVKQAGDDSITTCAWFPDSKRYVCGGKMGQYYMVDVTTNQVVEQWEGVRVYGLHCLQDSKVLAADSRNRIRCYDWECVIDHPVLDEPYPIISFCVNKDETYALLQLKEQGLHLWDIKCNTLVRMYRGHEQKFYIIHACFGGTHDEYLATGSEDHTIYIYHREKETPISKLDGHLKAVTCVDWHPHQSGLLVSCSDDGDVKLWRPSASPESDNDIDDDEDEDDVIETTAMSDSDDVTQQLATRLTTE